MTATASTGSDAWTRVRKPAWLLAWLRPVWRHLPAFLKRSLLPWAEAVQQRASADRLRRSWRRGAPPGRGVAVVGFHGAVLGLGEGARIQAAVWRAAGVDVQNVDVSALTRPAEPSTLPLPDEDRVVVSHLNPPELMRYLALTEGKAIAGRRHIGYWAWELPDPPASWRHALEMVDEVWVPSGFVRESIRRLRGPLPPIRVVPHPVHLLPRPQPAAPWLPAPAPCAPDLSVLIAMDLRSSLARKNFAGVVALVTELAHELPGQLLVRVKLSGGDAEPTLLRECLDALGRCSGVQVLTGDLADGDMASLIEASDVVLSLHRSEGFGLLLAHGMHAGKLVMATGWSGNCDFMLPGSAIVLPFTLVPVNDPSGRYAGAYWAEPNMAEAKALLRRALTDPAWRQRLARRAPARLHQALGGTEWVANSCRSLFDAGLAR